MARKIEHVKKVLRNPEVLLAIALAWESIFEEPEEVIRSGKWYTYVRLGGTNVRLVERYDSELEAQRIVKLYPTYLGGYTDCLTNFTALTMDCSTASSLLEKYILETLWSLERDQVNDHLRSCKECLQSLEYHYRVRIDS